MEKYALFGGSVLTGHRDMAPQRGLAVLVEDGKIRSIVSDTAIPTGFSKIDLQGQYLMPGLINLHVHLAGSGKPKKKASDPVRAVKLVTANGLTRKLGQAMVASYAKQQLLSGVTTIRTVGGIQNFDSLLRDKINAGSALGPRILAGNMAVSVPGGHMAGSLGHIAHTPEEAEAYVSQIADSGADLIKLMITGGVLDAVKQGEPGVLKMEPAIIRAACIRAHELGLKVAAHVESPQGVRAALENGVDTIEHGAMPDEDTLELFRQTGASLVTTISPTLSFALFDPTVSHATPMQKYNGKIVMDGIVACAKACLAAGIPVGLGTDTACPYVTQYDTWRELVYFRRFCGVTAAEALYTATLGNAQIAGIDRETGSIDPGKSADLLVTRDNPLTDLTTLREPSMVIFRGRRIRSPKVSRIPQVDQELDNYL